MRVKYLSKIQHLDTIKNCVVSIGFFDGFHKGHQSILEQVNKSAFNNNYKSVIFTFDISFLKLYKKNEKQINALFEQINVFNYYDIDYLYIINSQEVMNLSANEFINCILDKINTKIVVAGKDLKFGKNQLGNINDLKKYELIIVDEYQINKNKLSSKYLRNLLLQKNVCEANNYLFETYNLQGYVIKGLQNGSKISFPTANLLLNKENLLLNGVYFGIVILNQKKYKAMINIGLNPTISCNNQIKVEVYILDLPKQELYNRYLKIHIFTYHRNEIKFLSLDELKLQLELDKEKLKLTMI